MLGHAYRTVGKELGDRAEEQAEGATSWKAAIRAILLELLPLDERRAKGYRVSVAFAARATWNPELGAELRKVLKELQDIFVDMLSRAGVPDAERDSTTLLALNAGLAEPLMYGDGTPEQVVAALDAYLDRVF
jgi:TetR/AcrR family transcriptional regulator, transcriptional repressor of bet genes